MRTDLQRLTGGIAAGFAAFIVAGTPSSAIASSVRRFALLVGHNDGGQGTAPLRYAETDAEKMRSVLTELGGFQTGDLKTVLGESADQVLGALDDLERRIAQAKAANGSRTMLLVYYSGHGKHEALRMGSSRLSMANLRERIKTSSADMRIGIIDSCESGAITREKGGRRGPSFLFDADDREPAKGLILITSSADDESSQESDELGGSFFTHYLASGLRGDADESGDRRITLSEVYAYTYHKTVSVTAGTRSGTQHPTYSYDLKGNGDIILTDLSQGRSGVLFGAALEGDYLLFDMEHEQVVAEIRKVSGVARRIAVSAGRYVVKKRLTDHLRMARFTLAENSYYPVDESRMETVAFEDDYAKGLALRLALERKRTRVGFKAFLMYQGFFSGRARQELFPPVALVGLATELAPIWGARMGLDVAVGGTKEQRLDLRGLDLSYDFFEAQVGMSLIWRTSAGPFDFFGGPRLAGMYFMRSFPDDQRLLGHTQDYFGLSPSAIGGVALMPGSDRDLAIELTGRVGFLSFAVDENRALFLGEVGLAVGYRL